MYSKKDLVICTHETFLDSLDLNRTDRRMLNFNNASDSVSFQLW